MMQYLQHLDRHVIFAICLFGAVAVLAFVLIDALMNRRENPLQQRLAPQKPTDSQPTAATARAESTTGPFAATVQMISKAASRPIMPKEREQQSKLRVRLAHAGVYSPGAVPIFVGCKLIGLFAGFIAGGLLGMAFSTQIGLLLACWMGLMGYMLPGFWLGWQM